MDTHGVAVEVATPPGVIPDEVLSMIKSLGDEYEVEGGIGSIRAYRSPDGRIGITNRKPEGWEEIPADEWEAMEQRRRDAASEATRLDQEAVLRANAILEEQQKAEDNERLKQMLEDHLKAAERASSYTVTEAKVVRHGG